ncbi:MAG: acetamidase/formamidase family protein [Solirubrobacteraceae bacterium]|nr:acetamidase/formamidase family protein [Solirubrobacteraceae bacterium]
MSPARTPLVDDPTAGHNRFHPGIPPQREIAPGDTLTVVVLDGCDHQIGPTTTADQLKDVVQPRSHPMAGPFAIAGAEPGDVLEVEVLDFQPDSYGWTFLLPGYGHLRDHDFAPFLVHWELSDGVARSAQLPGITIPGRPFLGIMGVGLGHTEFDAYKAREAKLPQAPQPTPEAVVPATAADGLRTVGPRENGGNLDVKQLTAGSRFRVTVQVPGANLSLGDMHFAQGDGETMVTAIETSGTVSVRVTLDKDPKYRPTTPAFWHPHTVEDDSKGFFVTTGIPVTDDGENRFHDVGLAARNAVLEMTRYLGAEHGLTEQQALILVSVAVDLRIGSIVNDPNTVVTANLPLSVFDE